MFHPCVISLSNQFDFFRNTFWGRCSPFSLVIRSKSNCFGTSTPRRQAYSIKWALVTPETAFPSTMCGIVDSAYMMSNIGVSPLSLHHMINSAQDTNTEPI